MRKTMRSIWHAMIDRCHNENNKKYKNYGERGISVCDEWRYSFDTFYKDVGSRPSKEFSLDRINPNGNYCNENIRWANKHIQGLNTVKMPLSGVRGATKRGPSSFEAQIRINKKKVYLGIFKTPQEASKVYFEALERLGK